MLNIYVGFELIGRSTCNNFLAQEGIGSVPLRPEDRRANFSHEAVKLGSSAASHLCGQELKRKNILPRGGLPFPEAKRLQQTKPALEVLQVCQSEPKVDNSKQGFLTDMDAACLLGGEVCNPNLELASPNLDLVGHSFFSPCPSPTLQPGKTEWILGGSRLAGTILVKGRRHILSVLKPVGERVHLKATEPHQLEMKTFSVKDVAPCPWGFSRNWQVGAGQGDRARFVKMNPETQMSAAHHGQYLPMERRWLEGPRQMLSFPCTPRRLKGQSSRERGMSRAAMDERNLRERFWRLRERTFVNRLHDILPRDKKESKVVVSLY